MPCNPVPLPLAFALAALMLGTPAALAETQAAAAGRGKEIAERVCSGCHAINHEPGSVQKADVPSFRAIASRPLPSPESLQTYIMTPRHPMPAIPLELKEIRDVVSYIESLK